MKTLTNILLVLCTMGLLVACNEEKPTAVTDDQKEETTETVVQEEEKKVEETKGYKVGDYATDFSLKNVDGKMVSMAGMTDAKGAIVIFTCNHCPYSIAYEDRIIALDKKYKALGYPVIAINPNDPAEAPSDGYPEMQERAKEKGFTFPYIFDEGQAIYPQYGAEKTPHVYVVKKTDKGNEVVYIGAIDDSKDEEEVTEKYLDNAMMAVTKGEAPSPSSTKAFGCSIKTSKKM